MDKPRRQQDWFDLQAAFEKDQRDGYDAFLTGELSDDTKSPTPGFLQGYLDAKEDYKSRETKAQTRG